MKIKSKKWVGIGVGVALLCLALAIGLGIYLHSTSQSAKPQRETHSSKITVNQFIKKIAPIAQKEQKKYHIPASIIIAQAGTESNWGRSKLAYKYNNLFGIKATSKKIAFACIPKKTSMARQSKSSSILPYTIAGRLH